MKPRLFLAEDDHSIRQMLAFVLSRTCACEIVGEAGNGKDALDECRRLRPSLLITDLRLPERNGVELLQEIRRRSLGIAVIFYTGAMSEKCVAEAIAADPDGFVLKSDELPALRQAVAAVSSGGTFWAAGAKALRDRQAAGMRQFSELTPSEREVLKLIATGKCTKEIAAALCKSEHTISHQRQSLMNKLQVHNAVGLAALARKANLVD